MSTPEYADATINVTGKTTNWVNLAGKQLVGFYTPATLNSTALTFNMTPSIDTIASKPVGSSAGASLSFTVTTGTYYGFTQDQTSILNGVTFVQVAVGTNETAPCTIKLATIPRPSI